MVDPAAKVRRKLFLWARIKNPLLSNFSAFSFVPFSDFADFKQSRSTEESTQLTALWEGERSKRSVIQAETQTGSYAGSPPRSGVGGALAVHRRNDWPWRCSGWIIQNMESTASSSPAGMRQNSRFGVLRPYCLPSVWAIPHISPLNWRAMTCPTVSPAEIFLKRPASCISHLLFKWRPKPLLPHCPDPKDPAELSA